MPRHFRYARGVSLEWRFAQCVVITPIGCGSSKRSPLDECLVVDQKDDAFSPGSRRRSVRRKDKFKSSPTTIGIFRRDGAAVRFKNRTCNCQPHSQSFVFSSEERVEQRILHLRRNSGTVITHARRHCTSAV